MVSWLFLLVILGVFGFEISNAVPVDSNQENEVRKFIKNSAEIVFSHDMYDNLKTEIWRNIIEGNKENSIAMENIMAKLARVTEIARNASIYHRMKCTDPELIYVLENLKRSADFTILGKEEFKEIISFTSVMNILPGVNMFDEYKNQSHELSYFDIQNIIAKSNDPDEIEYYWNVWREIPREQLLYGLFNFDTSLRWAAYGTGISALEFWMKNFNLTQMDAVMAQLEPAYRQIHGFIRHQLNKKYGDGVISTQGLIPDHLFQQVLVQTWTSEGVLEEMFPFKELPSYEEQLVKNNFDIPKMYKTADKFYETMGFDKVPEYDWDKHLSLKPKKEFDVCKTQLIGKTQNHFIHNCSRFDLKTLLQTHNHMALLHMAQEKSNLPGYYSDSYKLEYAVGEAAILSAFSPKYLNKIGLLPSSELSEQVFMNQLMRLNLQTMLNIPVYYVHTKLMADLFAGQFKIEELNIKYWELMDKFVGVGPPGDRVSNILDLPYIFFVELYENMQARKFMSEVLGYQFYSKLCSIADQYPKRHLQNCDFSGSTAAGDALKKMIKLGSSKPLPEVLATLLPEDPKLNAGDLLEYYSPSLNWIVEENKQLNVNIGWTHLDKKVNVLVRSKKFNEEEEEKL